MPPSVLTSLFRSPHKVLVIAMDKDEKPLWAVQVHPTDLAMDMDYADPHPRLRVEGHVVGDVQDYTL